MHDQDVFLERALIEDRLLTSDQLAEAKRYEAEHNVDLVDALVRSRILGGRDIALARANVCETPFVALGDYEPCYANTQLLPRSLAERYFAFPLFIIYVVLNVSHGDL